MTIQLGFKTRQEAEKAAITILQNDREEPGKVRVRSEVSETKDGGKSSYYAVEDIDTGATAYIAAPKGGSASFLFLSKDEAKPESRTYPFRDIPKEVLPYLMAPAVRTPIVKPTTYLTPKAVQKYKGMIKLLSFVQMGLAYSDYKPYRELEGKYTTKETAFDDLGQLRLTIIPSELSEITGIEINGAEDYAKAIGSILNASLSPEEENIAKETYSFNNSYLFLCYAIYEFFRTERYDHLKEVLAQYREFGLPEDWYKGFTFLTADNEDETPERYVLARYLSRRSLEMAKVNINLRDIAKYIGAPLPLLLRSYEHKYIYDF